MRPAVIVLSYATLATFVMAACCSTVVSTGTSESTARVAYLRPRGYNGGGDVADAANSPSDPDVVHWHAGPAGVYWNSNGDGPSDGNGDGHSDTSRSSTSDSDSTDASESHDAHHDRDASDRVSATSASHAEQQQPPTDTHPGHLRRSLAVGINYHGGPVMTATAKVYYIYYGNWWTTANGIASKSLLQFLATNIGGTPYWNINHGYTQTAPAGTVPNAVSYVTGIQVAGEPLGKSLTDANIKTIVTNSLNGVYALLPADVNAVYFVLTAPDIAGTSGLWTSYCGWHTYGTIVGKTIKYSFIGNPQLVAGLAGSGHMSACAGQALGPNGAGVEGADAMASVIAHELAETVTDPQLSAWWDSTGKENADKCAWTWGATTLLPSGAKWNIELGPAASRKKFLIQRNWAVTGVCTMVA